jgi:hypothetical protein
MTDILKDKTIIAEISENDIGCLIIVENKDVAVAKDAIAQARNIWLNYEDSDEHMDLLSDQIAYVLDGRYINYFMPDFEEV